ncbi:uncharacterized protein LOC116117110 [Pistacia vera]|uniref:uncharacterized protein LOC116117110 n=1 Tax=Pistacia vera TaxID=55513 RepID=UPI001262CA28|nr:uncharacterized protein LOC116117110 [Pistacia vera]
MHVNLLTSITAAILEINSIHLDRIMQRVDDDSDGQLLSPSSTDMSDSFDDPEVVPRVGHEYQAEIPPVVLKDDYLQQIDEPTDSKTMINLSNRFSLGLHIPLMWANTVIENVNGTLEFENIEESRITSNDEISEPKDASLGSVLCDGNEALGYSDLQCSNGSHLMDGGLVVPQESKNKLDQVDRGLCLLPGSLGESWVQTECESFLLGLYIFGKNLNLVKRFVESKGMGDVLSFYYGQFYRSDGYRRWLECWKLRSKRFVHGQKIFTGWRLQELLSRLVSHVSEECKNMLLEASRKFGEGKISFEEYVFTLKNTVGVKMLIEAVGVGKGKQDLTGTAMEPIKTNHVFSLRFEIPVGKACSSLKPANIIRFLRGDFRLSKARSNDLFWEAVWPRLLAKGWHSEQPKDHGFSGSKNSLIFLIPGVKKFSRRKLVKGDHYFDSISDVLNKVASDPGLLELESEAAKGVEQKEEDKLDQPMKQDADGLSNKQHHCYLQPRKSNYSRHLIQFTIVDTSLFQGAGRPKVRELRSLPAEISTLSAPSNLSSESEEDTSDDEEDEEETNTTTTADNMTDKGVCVDSSDCANSILNNSMPNTPSSTNVAVENHNTGPVDKQPQQLECSKYEFCQNANAGHSKCLACAIEPEDLTTCNHGDSSCGIDNICVDQKLDENVSDYRSNLNDACDMVYQLGPPQRSPASSLAKGSPDRSYEEDCLDREVSPEKPEHHTLIDLNLPQVSSDFGNDEPFTDMVQNSDNVSENKSSTVIETSHQVEELKLADDRDSRDKQLIMNNRRQSTRNRPLTTKALEALAFGYLSPKRKRKDAEAPQSKSVSKTSRRVRGKTDVSGTLSNGAGTNNADSRIEQSLDALYGNTNIVGESQV